MSHSELHSEKKGPSIYMQGSINNDNKHQKTDQKLKGQVAIVTVASSGIGAGCARELAKAGATVMVNDPLLKAISMAESVVEQIVADGGSAISYKCDVSKEEEVQQMFGDVINQFVSVDILINNAGLDHCCFCK